VVAAVAMLVASAPGCARRVEPTLVRDDVRAVPRIAGTTVAAARKALEGEGLVLHVEPEAASATICEESQVVAMNPDAGVKVAPGTTITLTVRACPSVAP
jgi:beta-lactam-binding protein with PASTA domain